MREGPTDPLTTPRMELSVRSPTAAMITMFPASRCLLFQPGASRPNH